MNKQITITPKLNEEYSYIDIESFCKWNNFELEEIGDYHIGENFLICKQDYKAISFILTGTMGEFGIYKCIYNDLEQ